METNAPLKADFYYDYIDFEWTNGQIYQLNGITTPNGAIFAPYGAASNTTTFGRIDCGAINEFVAAELGQYKYTAWYFAANYYIGGHC
jgi:hypothetical protein